MQNSSLLDDKTVSSPVSIKSKKAIDNPFGFLEKKTDEKSDLGFEKEKKEIACLEKTPKKIEDDVINLIPKEVSEKYKIVAFEKTGDLVKIAMVNPKDIGALNALRFVAEKENIELEVYQASEDIFLGIIEQYSGPAEALKEAVKSFKKEVIFDKGEEESNEKIKKQGEFLKDAPVTKLVEVIVGHAVEGSASDIHIEPMDKDYRVRFRVDGILHVSLIMPKEIGPAVISRIKILANLKIDEKRKPQDGRFRTISEGKEIDFRVSTLPVISGEKVVMRILDKDQGLANIEALGLFGTALENVKKALKETYGMILFTGPTGSGKSTSLYALLKILNIEERNIITLEDPIEYNIGGVNQSQINPDIGYSFANGLRNILRQDPNIIMLGEIRDSETAALSIHAALTGHLVLSTLHTNTAIGAVSRMIDMGVEPFLLASSLRMVIAQRLGGKICEKCREEITVSESMKNRVMQEIKNISPEEIKKYKLDLSTGLHFFKGKGCEECGKLGLKGRVAIFEVVPISEAMRDIIIEKKGNENLLTQERNKEKIITMKQDGILKILKGMTTIEEVERVTEGNIGLLIDEE